MATRLDVNIEQSTPLLAYYKEKGVLRNIDGLQAIEKVFGDIQNLLKGQPK